MAKLTVNLDFSDSHSTWVMTFLRHLEVLVTPPVGQHHSFTYAQFGSDQTGWEDKLCLGIRYSNGARNYLLDDADLAGLPEQAAARVAQQVDRALDVVPSAGVR